MSWHVMTAKLGIFSLKLLWLLKVLNKFPLIRGHYSKWLWLYKIFGTSSVDMTGLPRHCMALRKSLLWCCCLSLRNWMMCCIIIHVCNKYYCGIKHFQPLHNNYSSIFHVIHFLFILCTISSFLQQLVNRFSSYTVHNNTSDIVYGFVIAVNIGWNP